MSQNLVGGQLAFALAGDDKPSFENFWVGDNSELVAALKSAVSHSDGKVIYYYGPEGCGKSHLLYAVTRMASHAEKTTSYLSLLDAYVTPDVLEVVNVNGIVCIDNIQAWAGDNAKERQLFTLFEQIKHAGGQLIVSAKQAPEVSEFCITDLVSRLSSGLIYSMQEMDDQQRFHALQMRADHRGLTVSNEVLKYLVTRATRDTSELFALLEKIDKASLAEKRKVTIPFLQGLLSSR